MSWLQALVLGAVQGASEFLPISSSAHLVLVPWWLGWQFEGHAFFRFSVAVHWGTLAAVMLVFRSELLQIGRAALASFRRRGRTDTPEAKLGWLLILATVPGSLAGVTLGAVVEQAFANPPAVAGLLLGTAALLAAAERSRARRAADPVGFRSLGDLTPRDGLLVGLAQAIALLPGVSRSGATIAAGVFRGLDRVEAVRFSFLMSVPIVFGAGLVAIADLAGQPALPETLAVLAVGFLASGLVGYLAIRWLLRYLAGSTLWGFSAYCALIGIGSLLRTFVGG